MFSQLCQKCGTVSTATFCEKETCRAKFILQPGYSWTCCPLHDPVLLGPTVLNSFRLRILKKALLCPKCESNLSGIKEEDLGKG